jgi:hypothetical protein
LKSTRQTCINLGKRVASYEEREKKWDKERADLYASMKRLIEIHQRKSTAEISNIIRTVHKYDIVIDINIAEYVSTDKFTDWNSFSADVITALDKLGADSPLVPVVALRRIVFKENDQLHYVFQPLNYILPPQP